MTATSLSIAAGIFLLAGPALAAPETTTQSVQTIAAGPSAQSIGIASYALTVSDVVGCETLDSVELFGPQGQYLGQALGGVIDHTAPYEGYLFTELDMVGMPRLRTLAAGDIVLYFYDEAYVGEATTGGVTGDFNITVDQGLDQASSAIQIQAAVLGDEGLRLAMMAPVGGRSVSIGPGAGGPLGGGGGGQGAAADDDCPWWIAAGACATAAACALAAEIPPPCWGAIVVCVGCGLMAMPPGATPPGGNPPREPMNLCITYAIGTPVHTPNGTVPIENLSVGDVVLSMDENLQPVLATVSERITRAAQIGSSTTVGGEELLATRGHRVMSARGWIPMEKASYSGVFCVDGSVQSVISDEVPAVGPNAPAETTVVHIKLNGGEGYFVGQSGLYAEAR